MSEGEKRERTDMTESSVSLDDLLALYKRKEREHYQMLCDPLKEHQAAEFRRKLDILAEIIRKRPDFDPSLELELYIEEDKHE